MDVSQFDSILHEILKVEAALIVFGISLGGLVLEHFSESEVNVQQVVSILLLSSGLFAFSMIGGIVAIVTKPSKNLRKIAGWFMVIYLLCGLILILIGWSLIIGPALRNVLP